MERLLVRPEIALNQFLPIFVESTLVLIFGVGYAAVITLAKMGYLSQKWIGVGYLFWILQTYFLYDFSLLIHSNYFTSKVLMITMFIYLFVPHLYFYLIDEAEKKYEDIHTKNRDNSKGERDGQ